MLLIAKLCTGCNSLYGSIVFFILTLFSKASSLLQIFGSTERSAAEFKSRHRTFVWCNSLQHKSTVLSDLAPKNFVGFYYRPSSAQG